MNNLSYSAPFMEAICIVRGLSPVFRNIAMNRRSNKSEQQGCTGDELRGHEEARGEKCALYGGVVDEVRLRCLFGFTICNKHTYICETEEYECQSCSAK